MQEDLEQPHSPKKVDPTNSHHPKQSKGKSSENPNEIQGSAPSEHTMPDQNHEAQEEEDMKDAIPEGLDLIALKMHAPEKISNLSLPIRSNFFIKL